MMARSLIVLIQGLYFAGMQFYLTQPIVQTLNSTGPLFVYLLDYKINNVKVTRTQFIGIIIGIIGVLFTVNG
jgi:drug/metabolite transporter (DMT)-like permease